MGKLVINHPLVTPEKAQALLAEAQDQAEEIDWDTIDVGEPLDEDYE